eukprot:scaffold2368_cov289-Chaetoceros_neogracile.AAC.25
MKNNSSNLATSIRLFVVLKILLFVQASSGSSSIYPVNNLESSLAASSSQASVIALRCHDCIVVLSMSPPSKDQTCNLTLSNAISANDEVIDETQGLTDTNKEDGSGLIPITHRGPISTVTTLDSSSIISRGMERRSRIMHLLQEKSGLALFMTGFASDTQYLARYAAGHISQEEQIYAGTYINARDLVRNALGPIIQRATLSSGSRPFGVQALAVSPAKPNENDMPRSTSAMIMTTLDPSGNLRYWHGMGAFIGKDSNLNQKHLHQILEKAGTTLENKPETWRDGLHICIKALLETAEESQNLRVTPSDEIISELDALVIFDNRGMRNHSCARIDQKVLNELFSKCYASTSEKNVNTNS